MRISELSRASGVPIPTIKFYLREGLLPSGHRTAPNQASYAEEHVRRLRLIRVLVEIGRLRLASVRRVLETVDRDDASLHDILAAAHTGVRRERPAGGGAADAVRDEVDAWLDTLGWELAPDSPPRGELAATLGALRGLGWPVGPEIFARYAAHADALAEAEIAYVARLQDRQAAIEAAVIGTVLFERAFSALRRLAHERHSRIRFGGA